jgi:hypothetical protein
MAKKTRKHKLHTGKKGGRYYLRKGRKVYVGKKGRRK